MRLIKLSSVIILLILAANVVLAADRNEQAKQLMKVLEFDKMLESQRMEAAKMVEDQMNSIITQIQNSNPNLPEAFINEFRAAAQKFGGRVANSWDSTEAATIYLTALVEGFPEDEMNEAIEHYKTPQGKKELKVINEATNKVSTYIMGNIKKETEMATKDFINEIKIIVQREKNKAGNAQNQ